MDTRQVAPWVLDARPDLWVRVGAFARLINRTPQRVFQMVADGALREFGYQVYRDPLGNYFFRISEQEQQAIAQFPKKARKSS